MVQQFGMAVNLLKTLTSVAAIHHDLGHLPFTYLMEEVFDELHWSLDPWSEFFQHDVNILETAHTEFIEESTGTFKRILQGTQGMSLATFKEFIGRYIEGRSGLPFVDAILNSPLDSDKIDYIFRDCMILNASIHLPMAEEKVRGQGRQCGFATDAQEILPSGVIALHGRAGEHARQLLEERRWLYKHLYFRPPFRVVERVARGIITLWVLHFVTKKVIEEARAAELGVKPLDLNDVRAIKGVTARELLWDRLKRGGGEPEMIVAMADDLANLDGVVAPRCKEWIGDCREVVQSMLTHKGEEADSGIERKLRRCATWSQRMYVGAVDLPRIGEIVRELEVKTPFSV